MGITIFPQPIKDYLTELFRGKVPNTQSVFVTGNNPNIGTTQADISDFGGTGEFPTEAESVEILSDSTDDESSGTGVRTVLLTSLNDQYVEITTPITMNGTTPVAVPGTHIAYRQITALTVGANSDRSNIGTLTLRVSSGGVTRLQMQPTQGNSFSSLYTVPANKEFVLKGLSFFVEKGQDVIIRPRFIVPVTDGAHIASGPAPLYQSITNVAVLATAPLFATNQIYLQGISTNENVNATTVMEGELIDLT